MSGKGTSKRVMATLLSLVVSAAPLYADGPRHGESHHGDRSSGHYGHNYHHSSCDFWWASAGIVAGAIALDLLATPAQAVIRW